MRLDDLSAIDPSWIQARLEDAVQTHDIMPPAVRLKVRTMFDTLNLKETPEPDDQSPFSKLSATSRDINRMYETLEWLRLVPAESLPEKRMKMDVLFLRAKTRGGKNCSWRRIAEAVGISHTKAEYVHFNALSELTMEVYRKYTTVIKQ